MFHDWEAAVPDTSQLPPPPPMASEYSSTTNASYDEAAAAHAWCARNHVYTPQVPNVHLIETVQAGQHELDRMNAFGGSIVKLDTRTHPSSFSSNAFGAKPTTVSHVSSASNPNNNPKPGRSGLFKSSASTPSQAPPGDQILTSLLPFYFAATSNPLSPHFAAAKPVPYTIYFEITPQSFHSTDATLAVGFAAKPFPTNRQPGWHRASIGVHSDDGNRYVNDSWGGRPFTSPFRVGETLGLAVVFIPELVAPSSKVRSGTLTSEHEVQSSLPRCKTRCYFTRNGNVEGSWEMDEERDAEKDEGIAGLQGEADIYAAVGMYGLVECEVRFYAQGEGFIAPPIM